MSDKETGFSVLRTGVMFDRDLSVTELQFESVPVTERKINALKRKTRLKFLLQHQDVRS